MKYILREIDSEEEFIKTFGQNPKWIFSPLRMTTKVYKERLLLNTWHQPHDGVSDDERNLKIYQVGCGVIAITKFTLVDSLEKCVSKHCYSV